MNFDLIFYWKLLLRRLPLLMLPVLICSGLAIAVAQRLPATYASSSQLLVESPQIPERMVASTVRTGELEQLQVIRQRLVTRSNLLDLASKHKVFADQPDLTPDEIVAAMRQATGIRQSSGRDQATIMTIRFTARSGQIAASVVNEYVTQVLAENADFRRSRVEGTLEFFEQEVLRLGSEIDQQSALIVEFNNTNAGALPGDRSFRLDQKTILTERQERLARERASLVTQREQIETLFQNTGRVTSSAAQAAQLTPEERRLGELEQQLQQALLVYSETNPRVALLKRQIAQQERLVAQNSLGAAADEEAEVDPNAELYRATIADLDGRLEELDSEISRTSDELEDLEVAINASAANALALEALQRDMRTLQAQYDRAVQNRNNARLSERIEVSSQGQRISVLEAAVVPNAPSGPNRTAIAAMGLASGLGLAGAIFVLLEILNRSIRRPVELQSRFGIIPIATIPYMESASRKWIRRGTLVVGTLVAIIGVPAALWWIDTNYMPLQLIVAKGLEQIGLG